jgi:hypothetical protein
MLQEDAQRQMLLHVLTHPTMHTLSNDRSETAFAI